MRNQVKRIFNTTVIMRAVGSLSFFLGFILAVLAGWLWPDRSGLSAALVVLGLVVGLLNITGREVIPFLVATMALVVIGQGAIFSPLNDFHAGLGVTLDTMVDKVALFAAPAGIVNALRAAVALARPGGTSL